MTLLSSSSGPCDGSDCPSDWHASVVSGGLTEVPGMTPAEAQTGGVAAAAVPVEAQATVVSAVVPAEAAPVVARVGDL